jgi:chromosome segregation ATPase
MYQELLDQLTVDISDLKNRNREVISELNDIITSHLNSIAKLTSRAQSQEDLIKHLRLEMEDKESELVQLSKQISEIKREHISIRDDNTHLESRYKRLSSNYDNLLKDYTRLESAYDRLEKKKPR